MSFSAAEALYQLRCDGAPEAKSQGWSGYTRHGTVNLFVAPNVVTGVIQSKVTAVKKRPDFQTFIDDVIKDAPETQDQTRSKSR